MKQIYLSLIAIFLISSSLAQNLITTFHGEYLEKTYKVEATKPDAKGRFELYIEMISLDKLSDQIKLRVHRNSLEKCRTVLNAVAEKYVEWSTIAIKNHTEKINKAIEVKIPNFVFSAVFKYGDWHQKANIKPLFVFSFENGKAQLIISTGKVQATDNQFISSVGGVIALSSLDEITSFINCFDEKLVDDFYLEKNSIEDLFQ